MLRCFVYRNDAGELCGHLYARTVDLHFVRTFLAVDQKVWVLDASTIEGALERVVSYLREQSGRKVTLDQLAQ